jgi:signal transduction histidine kinase
LNLACQPAQERDNLDAAAMPSVREALDCLRIAITVFDADERLIFVNRHFNHLFRSLPPRDELIGLGHDELIRLELAGGEIAGPDVPQDVEHFLAERRSQFAESERRPRDLRLTDGRIVEIKARRTANGGWIALWTDVSSARSGPGRAEADCANAALWRTMSHELKTPLNAIIGFSDLLASMADRLGPEQVKEYAGLVHQGGNNLLRLLNQILDLTKITAGRYELRRSRVDAGSLLWLAKNEFQAQAQKKDIVLDADCCPAGLFVDADESALAAMAGHLIENAVNFTQEGGTVRLSVSKDGNAVKIGVSDNGPGVAACDLERILKPFEQVRRNGERPRGAGLGQTLVKAFCELHGGTLKLESQAGFTATIELPAAEA